MLKVLVSIKYKLTYLLIFQQFADIKNNFMLIIEVKPGENIDRALKKFKNKVRKVKQVLQLIDNQHFTKKSFASRVEVGKAKYIQNLKDTLQD